MMGGMAATVWVVFIGAYSDRRAVAVFDSEAAAIQAGEALLGQKYVGDTVELERFTVRSDGTAGLGRGRSERVSIIERMGTRHEQR